MHPIEHLCCQNSHCPDAGLRGRGNKTYGFSRELRLHRAASYLIGYSYNFCWCVRTLRVRGGDGRWQPQTPAMAAGLTDHVWCPWEWLTYPAKPRQLFPDTTRRRVGGKTPALTVPQMRQIVTRLLRQAAPTHEEIAEVVTRALRRNEESRIYHRHKAAGKFPPRRARSDTS